MDNKEILKKAIEKAVDNGWNINQWGYNYLMCLNSHGLNDHVITEKLYYHIIFSHDFAKAFFHCDHELEPYQKSYQNGSYWERCVKCKQINPIGFEFANWKTYLKEMVTEKNPLKYLERFL